MGENAAQQFHVMLINDIMKIPNIPNKDITFGKEEKKRYDRETKCWTCGERGFSKDNCIYTEEVNKIALCLEDDKRVVLEDGIQTVAWGIIISSNKRKYCRKKYLLNCKMIRVAIVYVS